MYMDTEMSIKKKKKINTDIIDNAHLNLIINICEHKVIS